MSYATSVPFIAFYSLVFLSTTSSSSQSLTSSRTSTEMELKLEAHQRSTDVPEEAPPPSYYASLRSNAKVVNVSSHGRSKNVCQPDRPPNTNWFVRCSSDPSTWQLLTSGPLMSNVTTFTNESPTHKRRYRILYPASKYEDVYLHRPPWTAQTSAFPPYHIEVYPRQSRYNAEPIILLGSVEVEEESPDKVEARALAGLHTPRVISTIESQVKGMTRQATFVEMEFFSWDWTVKTAAANHDMRTMILRAKEQWAKSVDLVDGLENFLVYLGDDAQMAVAASLKRSCEEVRWKLEGLNL